METVLLVIHLLLALALIATVLMQKSEGGALGMGGGGGGGGASMGGLMTGRGAGNLLTRATAVIATFFICTSLTLAIMSNNRTVSGSVLDAPAAIAPIEAPAAPVVPEVPSVPLAE